MSAKSLALSSRTWIQFPARACGSGLARLQHRTFALASFCRNPNRAKFTNVTTKTAVTSRSTPLQQSQHRSITNATRIDFVSSLDSVRVAPTKPGGWKPTLVHSSGEVKFTVIRVEPGGEVPVHFHHESWDYFVPLEGSGSIETKAHEGGEERTFAMEPHSFLAVPPRDVHRVRNVSTEKEFVFLIAQSPRHKYDFIEPEEGGR